MSLAFLAKKTWHTSNLKNVEKVWIAEQKHAKEQQRLNELKKQIEEERQVQELRELQSSLGNKSTVVAKVDWMYDGPMASNAESTEEYLLGKKYAGSKDPDDDSTKISNQSKAVAAHFQAPKPASANEAFTRLHEDPLLAIKKKQQEARNHVLKNPRKMQMLQEQISLEKSRRKDKKKEKKDKKKEKKAEKKRMKKEHKEGRRPSPERQRGEPQHMMEEPKIAPRDDDEPHRNEGEGGGVVNHRDESRGREVHDRDRRGEERNGRGNYRSRSRGRDRRSRSRSRDRGRDRRSRSRDRNRRSRSRDRGDDRDRGRERGRGGRDRQRDGDRGRDDEKRRGGGGDRSRERGGRGGADERRDGDGGSKDGRSATGDAPMQEGLVDAASATTGGLIKPAAKGGLVKPAAKDGTSIVWSGKSKPQSYGLQPTKYDVKPKGTGLGPDDAMLAKRQKYLESQEVPDPDAIRREASKRNTKLTAEEKAAKIAAMSQDADVHDELRSKRFSTELAHSKAPETDMTGTNPLFLSKLGQESFANNEGVDALEKRVKQQRHTQQKGYGNEEKGFHRR
jgi:hypothetical protein